MRYDVVTDSEAKGLTVGVARPADIGDCTADGASSRFDRFTIVEIERNGYREPMPQGSQVFAPTEKAPAARLVFRGHLGRVWHLEPIIPGEGSPWLMSGGNYAAWSDSRISEITGLYGALHIHDRKEG